MREMGRNVVTDNDKPSSSRCDHDSSLYCSQDIGKWCPERWFLCLDLVSICVNLFLAQLPHRAHDGIAQSFLFALLQVA